MRRQKPPAVSILVDHRWLDGGAFAWALRPPALRPAARAPRRLRRATPQRTAAKMPATGLRYWSCKVSCDTPDNPSAPLPHAAPGWPCEGLLSPPPAPFPCVPGVPAAPFVQFGEPFTVPPL